jgi:hypothetical protein
MKNFISVLMAFILVLVGCGHALAQQPPARLAEGVTGLGAPGAQAARNVELVSQIGGADAHAVAVSGLYAYVGVGPRLVILDISDPRTPRAVGQSDSLPGIVNDVALGNNYAYVATLYAGLSIIAVSDPAHPYEVGAYDTPGWAVGVAVSGGYAYVADGDRGLRIIAVSDPAHPYEVGFYDTPGSAWDVAVSGGYAYVADGDSLRILDVSDPAHPYEVGSYDTPSFAWDVALSGSYAYVTEGKYATLSIISVSDPKHPREVGSYSMGWPPENVEMSGNYAYVAAGDLLIFDVSDPVHPREVGFYATPGIAWDVAVSGGYVYVADREGGLVILRHAPQRFRTDLSITGLALTQGALYAFDENPFSTHVFRQNTLWFKVKNNGTEPFVPSPAGQYVWQVVLKTRYGDGWRLLELKEWQADVWLSAPLPELQLGEEAILSLNDLFFFKTTNDGLLELFLIGPSETGNTRVLAMASRSISVSPHPEDPWNCAAWVATVAGTVANGAGMSSTAITLILAGWYAKLQECQGENWICYAKNTAEALVELFTQLKGIPDKARLLAETLVALDTAREAMGEEIPVCSIAVDWLNAIGHEWSRQGVQPAE